MVVVMRVVLVVSATAPAREVVVKVEALVVETTGLAQARVMDLLLVLVSRVVMVRGGLGMGGLEGKQGGRGE
jgi:hypothetical protein